MPTEEKKKQRKYNFPLPYKMSAMQVFYGLRMLKKDKLFPKLPPDIQQKMETAGARWSYLKVTEKDLNRIDDKIWEHIAKKLGLAWEWV